MCEILLSIKPEFVEKIFEGSKKYEFRRRKCKRNIDKIIIYETSPVQKVVGEVEVLGIIEDTPEAVWQRTYQYAGIEKSQFMDYFSGCSVAYGYEIKKAKKYQEPRALKDYGIQMAPQSYIYLS